ncbi:MAG: type II toxin-antitoxin system HicB family antitoxin [Propionibacteriaceae bacterium]|jgi:metal-responsive CopG/Arc/MetJ family transcriptional regulator|nr:type II toxin-antitoxin system HicB family antitoxin [Propionibacteriaceae bacterium]
MKTAISVPDELFRRVDDFVTSRHLTRSALYVRAVQRYIDDAEAGSLSEQVRQAMALETRQSLSEAADLRDAMRTRLARTSPEEEW